MKTSNKIISGLLVLLGFSGCSVGGGTGEVPDFPLMYGPLSPIEGFSVKGIVTDAAENPIEGIRVVVKPAAGEYSGFENDTVYTDAVGLYRSAKRLFIPAVAVAVSDVDGVENGGEFLPAESLLADEDQKWREGDVVVVLKKFTLDKKKRSGK